MLAEGGTDRGSIEDHHHSHRHHHRHHHHHHRHHHHHHHHHYQYLNFDRKAEFRFLTSNRIFNVA
jgi:hypothetical protein